MDRVFKIATGGKNLYIQATYLLKDESTIERKFGNLLKIRDNYPKYVISYDRFKAQIY